LESLNDVELLLSLEGLLLILLLLDGAPLFLDSQSFNFVFKSESVVLKGFSASFDDGLVLGDGLLKEGFSLGESLVLLLKVSALDGPLFSLSLFDFSELVSGGDELLSNLGKEIEDSDDGLVVNLGSELGKSLDDGLEEGVLGFSELGLDLVESALDLSEGDTSLEVLNDLAGFVDGLDGIGTLGVLLNPGLVLLGSEGGLGGE
jgi:hypothetical protein